MNILKITLYKMVTCIFLLFTANSTNAITKIKEYTLSAEQITCIGTKIWHNESGCSHEKLTWWNEGEEFPSFGIGHAIWFPDNYRGPFTEMFPALLQFLHSHNVTLPEWLKPKSHCPWPSRKEFFADFNGPRLRELRALLTSTIELQTRFIVERTYEVLPKLITHTSESDRSLLKKKFYNLASTPSGMYALIDYINFKGDGTNPAERYNNEGWGLLQVLHHMKNAPSGDSALVDFSESANHLLTKRIENSPKERNEKRWLVGWKNRIASYKKDIL